MNKQLLLSTEIIGMLGPGIDNKFLENFMGDLDQDESMMDINAPNSMSTFDSSTSFIDPDEIIEMKHPLSPINTKSSTNTFHSNTATPSPTGDPMLMQPVMTQYAISQNFTKVDSRSIQQQLTPNTTPSHNAAIHASPDNNVIIKPVLTSTPNPTQSIAPAPTQKVLISNSGYCNIKPAPPRNSIPASNVTQYQNVKPISIQSNVSVLPQVVTVHSLSSKEKSPIFVQSPTVMYTTAKVQPIANKNSTQVNILKLMYV